MYKNLRNAIFIVGVFSLIFTSLMLVPVLINYYNGHSWQNFFCAYLFTLFFSLICIFCGKLSHLKKTDVFVITSSIWVVSSIVSAVPFVFDAKISYIDAFFEAASGLTTTGATVLANLQDHSLGILMWRSLLNAVGGLGIVVTGIFLLSCLKVVNLHALYHSESSDQSKQFKYGIVKSSTYILMIYCILIALCAVLYRIAGMSWFDAICHAMSTVSTGGFSNYDDSLRHFDNVYIDTIAIVFMLLGSCPFIVYLKIITKQHFYDEQIIFFAVVILLSNVISILSYRFEMPDSSLFDVLRYSIFSVVSLSTSAGLVNCDYSNWHFFSVFGIFLMLMGGCSGSANGGIKLYRIVLLLKALGSYIGNLISPTKAIIIRYNKRYVSKDFICIVGLFFFLYIFILFISCILISMSGVDFITAFSAVSAVFGNVGPGMGNIVGPSANYYTLLPSVKLLLSFLMLMGRLEIIPFFVCIYLMLNDLFDNR